MPRSIVYAGGVYTNNTQREQHAIVVARRVSSALVGWQIYDSVFGTTGPRERGRALGPGGEIGAHLIPHSVIVDVVCGWLNSPIIGLPHLISFIGALLTPPPSYFTSPILVAGATADGILAWSRLLGVIGFLIMRNPGHTQIAIWGSALADGLSHLHTQMRAGHSNTNSSIGALVDARIARNRGLDPMAWMESLQQWIVGDPRPRLSTESIYAASLVRLVPGHGGDDLPWDTVGNPLDLRSSVDDDIVLRGNIRGQQRMLGMQAVYVNPFRSAARIPGTRIALPVSWWGLLQIVGLCLLFWSLLGSRVLELGPPSDSFGHTDL